LALTRVEPGRMARYNLGSGDPTSVRELLDACGHLAGAPVPHVVSAPRPGDPPRLVADISHARAELGWSPRWSGIGDILAGAWAWHSGPACYSRDDNEPGAHVMGPAYVGPRRRSGPKAARA
jgi:UDP-glucose 4-epimerase